MGWSADLPSSGPDTSRTLSTMAGLGLGSTRSELTSAYAVDVRQTSLGTEFEAGALFGIVDGEGDTARITAMWAGVVCVFR